MGKKIQYRRIRDNHSVVIGKHGLVETGTILAEGEVPAAFMSCFKREELEETVAVASPESRSEAPLPPSRPRATPPPSAPG